jgi:hypothetical protein
LTRATFAQVIASFLALTYGASIRNMDIAADRRVIRGAAIGVSRGGTGTWSETMQAQGAHVRADP